MAVTTRLFGAGDTANIWTLLNEIKGWIDSLGSEGTLARYWTGTPSAKTLTNLIYTSLRMNGISSANGGIAPTFDGDSFSLPAGHYRFSVQVSFGVDPTGYRNLYLLRNTGYTTYSSGSAPPGTQLRSVQVAATSNNTSIQATKLVKVAATDKFIIVVRQNSGQNLGLLVGPEDNELMIERIGD